MIQTSTIIKFYLARQHFVQQLLLQVYILMSESVRSVARVASAIMQREVLHKIYQEIVHCG